MVTELVETTYTREFKVKHWDIRIDADDRSYFITSLDETEAYKELMAALIKNNLIQRYLVFFIDGESRIYETIEKYFSPWSHAVYLDFHHLDEKIRQYMSSMIVTRRVDDPTAEKQYFVKGPRKGQEKPVNQTSLSQLYAKEAVCIAWSGNIAVLAAYIRLIPDADIKSESSREGLLTYLQNKEPWITCYRLRKRVGLPNSSNVVEQENQVLVSDRQKNDLMSWCKEGSSSLAALSALYRNNEANEWYTNHNVYFRPWTNTTERTA